MPWLNAAATSFDGTRMMWIGEIFSYPFLMTLWIKAFARSASNSSFVQAVEAAAHGDRPSPLGLADLGRCQVSRAAWMIRHLCSLCLRHMAGAEPRGIAQCARKAVI